MNLVQGKMKSEPTTRCTIISSVIYFVMYGKIASRNLYDVKAISAIYFKEGIDFSNTVKTYFSFDANTVSSGHPIGQVILFPYR